MGAFLKEPTHTHVRRLGLSHNFIFFHTHIETEAASGQNRLLKQVRVVIHWQRTAQVQPAAHWGSHKTRPLALINLMTLPIPPYLPRVQQGHTVVPAHLPTHSRTSFTLKSGSGILQDKHLAKKIMKCFWLQTLPTCNPSIGTLKILLCCFLPLGCG